MDMPAQEISVDNVLRVGFLFQILVRRASMGLRARLEAMESHSTVQKWKRPRSAFASLYSHDSDILNAPNAHGSALEENFYKQKDALISLAHSNIANREFSKQSAYAFDPLGFALPKPQLYDRLLSSKDKDSYPLDHAKLNYRLNSELRQGTASCDNVISLPEHSSTSPSAIAGMQDFNIRGTSVDLHPTPSELSMHVCSSNAIISSSDQHVSSQSKAVLSEVQGQYEGSLMGPFHDKAGFSTAQVVEKSIMKPYYKQLLEDIQKRDTRQKELDSKIEVQRIYWENLQRTKQALFALKRKETAQKAKPPELAPLSEKEEEEVRKALNGANRKEPLVQHEPSNIDLSREALQCLMPGAWLNDEVINLYMELLKERECREQKNYLKCHFFSTFFFNKLYKDAHSYNYNAVRRWTSVRKLGYSILECDKIFVPIHKDIHWCLAVIDLRRKKLQYLDSLKGQDMNALRALARYISDEAKDKGSEDIDTSHWELDCPKDIPAQFNGCDCGMFMIKYVDFLSRGDKLDFSQEDMEYFRKRTILELLQLRAR